MQYAHDHRPRRRGGQPPRGTQTVAEKVDFLERSIKSSMTGGSTVEREQNQTLEQPSVTPAQARAFHVLVCTGIYLLNT